jgi:3-hydroxyisobutyrate dehydrogenase-like beta-hydroxyacid dehydrogenase
MPDFNAGSKSYDVATIGCGLMGAALVRTFARSGLSVAAWNRTHERARALAGDGITPVRSISDAVRFSGLVVACLTTYEATRSALDPIDDWRGATLVNLASGASQDAEDMGRWAAERGAEYLDGTIQCYPQDIGSPEAVIPIAGPPAVWSKHERTLTILGGSCRHVSEQLGIPNVLLNGIGAFYISALGAYVEAATYMLGEGVSTTALRDTTVWMLRMLHRTTDEAAGAIASDDHETDQATLEIFAEGSRNALAAIRGAGHHARIYAATIENMDAAEAAGFGKLGFYAQTRIARTAGQATTSA